MGMNPGAPGFAAPSDDNTQSRRASDQERETMERAAERRAARTQIGSGGTLKVDGDLVVTGSITVPGTLASAGALSAGTNVTAVGNITAGASMVAVSAVFSGGVNSVGVYNTDVTTLPGGRTPVWVHVGGTFGQTISTIVKKDHLSTSLPFTAAQVLACIPYVYEYIGQIAIRDDPDNEYYDPDYEVPTEIGMMAEHLIANGLGIFVFYEEDHVTPKGIDYALFGAIANLVVLRDHEARLQAAGF